VIGGYVYRGPVQEFVGHYIFADHTSANVWKLDPDSVDWRGSVMKINSRLMPDAGSTRLFNPGAVYRLQTSSQTATWFGSDASSGAPGDGTTWSDVENWARDSVPDTAFVERDHVVFLGGVPQAIALGENRTASAVTFAAPYTLQGATLTVLSGNITVEAGITATIQSELAAETPQQSLRKLGSGTLVINGNAGQVALNEGTLSGTGTLTHLTARAGTTIQPGTAIGELNVDQTFRLDDGATLEIDVAGASQYDSLSVGGSVMLEGALVVNLAGFFPTLGQEFTILSADSIDGGFSSSQLPPLVSGLSWRLRHEAQSVVLAVGLMGDYNDDGAVNAADYTAWRNSFGQSGAGLAGDGNSDNVVTRTDYQLWKGNYGATSGFGAAVPEPAGGVILIAGALSILAAMRRTTRVDVAGSRIGFAQ
jgi:hypothetical protein